MSDDEPENVWVLLARLDREIHAETYEALRDE